MKRQSKARSADSSASKRAVESQFTFPAFGCWVNIFEPAVAELVGACGYQYALIDMEHSPVTVDSVLPMVRAVQLGGAKAIVRVPEKQSAWIGRLMDMGVDGIMVPMVNNAAEATELAQATIYAPEGTRGMAAGIVRASNYGLNTAEYLQNYRDNFMLIVQIETREGMEQAEQIAAVPGVDCVFIGPSDLAGSLGHRAQPEHKEVRAAIRQIYKNVKKTGKPVSTLNFTSRNAKQLITDGFDLVFSGSDMTMLSKALQQDVANNQKIVQGLVGSK
ncbi:HpcH/HpaI aldolase family protein [Granulosicoccus antarcticus]|uniref:4-hydroxy-2-oxo-heptane-1,7-dioate aldolase n=1 Tax=Granulosicoccus antarcticus IMCC3135 TaxID=1192854 RepID=A0A2Z2NSL4_9GAMM|nr:aldolase/citrate lyase family protein [Granulosicoccus antarcticus]ASJ70164.1 4-hydroxy-2-oxo-heptane-1,7-dioate aldolase [Granulosicoccus antarcticus IMCC3135]